MSDKTPNLPIALPGGDLVPFMSAKRRHQVVDVVFEMLGGEERLHHEANKSSDAYWEFMKLWGKGLPKLSGVEHNASNSVEQLLEKLDDAERAKTIDVEFYEVP